MEQVIQKKCSVHHAWNAALKVAAIAGVIVAALSGCASVPAQQTADANWCYSPGPDANCRPILEVGNWH